MSLLPSQIHRLAQSLDTNATPEDLAVARLVLDITLNYRTFNPVHLALRCNCSVSLATDVVYNLTKHHMLSPHWLSDDNDTINVIEFWLHVGVANGTLACRRE